jgi:hypothetical protein
VKYMMLLVNSEDEWDGLGEEERARLYERIEAWWSERAAAGEIIGGHELQPSETATTIRRSEDGDVTVTDGPFVEGKEMVGGFAILDVPDLDAAIRLASDWPSPGTVEIRPIVER